MKVIEISEVSALVPHVKPGSTEPLLLTDHGRVVATIVPADEDDAASTAPEYQSQVCREFGAVTTKSGIGGGTVDWQGAKAIGNPSGIARTDQAFEASAQRGARLTVHPGKIG